MRGYNSKSAGSPGSFSKVSMSAAYDRREESSSLIQSETSVSTIHLNRSSLSMSEGSSEEVKLSVNVRFEWPDLPFLEFIKKKGINPSEPSVPAVGGFGLVSASAGEMFQPQSSHSLDKLYIV